MLFLSFKVDSLSVTLCVEALRQVLPRDVMMYLMTRWYCVRNAPGSLNGQSEWQQFSYCLLQLAGYDISKITLYHKVS